MQNIKGYLAAAMLMLAAACEKVPDLPFYGNGTEPVLTASATTVAAVPADSNKVALSLGWTSPNYARRVGISPRQSPGNCPAHGASP
jgi:hypothetical protein